MVEDEDDNIDLLNEKKNSKNLEEFYQNAGNLDDLKNQIMMSMPEGQSRMGHPSISQPHTNQNTEAGETESSEEQAIRM